jgi:thiamine biosynthesis protein ThiS
MSLLVNGKEVAFEEQETVAELLNRLRFTFPLIIVKINGTLIKKKTYETTIIPDDARIDIVHMISGG